MVAALSRRWHEGKARSQESGHKSPRPPPSPLRAFVLWGCPRPDSCLSGRPFPWRAVQLSGIRPEGGPVTEPGRACAWEKQGGQKGLGEAARDRCGAPGHVGSIPGGSRGVRARKSWATREAPRRRATMAAPALGASAGGFGGPPAQKLPGFAALLSGLSVLLIPGARRSVGGMGTAGTIAGPPP